MERVEPQQYFHVEMLGSEAAASTTIISARAPVPNPRAFLEELVMFNASSRLTMSAPAVAGLTF
jgi:hypothetical protein